MADGSSGARVRILPDGPCGGSADKPHCDGTHKKLGFSHRPEEP